MSAATSTQGRSGVFIDPSVSAGCLFWYVLPAAQSFTRFFDLLRYPWPELCFLRSLLAFRYAHVRLVYLWKRVRPYVWQHHDSHTFVHYTVRYGEFVTCCLVHLDCVRCLQLSIWPALEDHSSSFISSALHS